MLGAAGPSIGCWAEAEGITMNADEWDRSTDPQKLLRFLGLKATERQLRLFAAACCRRNWGQLTDESLRRGIETAERFADGLVGQKTRGAAYAAAMQAGDTAEMSPLGVGFAAGLCS